MTAEDWAPTARRMPISLVRSVTESSMMFMMPMPPTMSETAAMEARKYGHGPAGVFEGLR